MAARALPPSVDAARARAALLLHDWKVLFNKREEWISVFDNEINKWRQSNLSDDEIYNTLELILTDDGIQRYYRWKLLYESVGPSEQKDVTDVSFSRRVIRTALVRNYLELVYVSPSAINGSPEKFKQPIICRAAYEGDYQFFKIVIEFLREESSDGRPRSLYPILNTKDPSGTTALHQAIIYQHSQIRDELLAACPSLVDKGCLVAAIDRNDRESVKRFAQVLKGNNTHVDWKDALLRTIQGNHLELATDILIFKPESFSIQAATDIVKTGQTQMWQRFEGYCTKFRHDTELLPLLFLAIQKGNMEFVKSLVSHYPDLITLKQDFGSEAQQRYPLWVNRHYMNKASDTNGKGDPIQRQAIRDHIVQTLIARPDLGLSSIREHLAACEEQGKEMCLDLSAFDARYPLKDFTKEKENLGQMTFERILKYVELPDLDSLSSSGKNALEHEPSEFCDMLEWLHKRGVEKIIRLTTRDREVQPHDEDSIAKWVEVFKIEQLNWRRLDLSVECLTQATSNDSQATSHDSSICSLDLYSSGNAATINEWFGPQGLKQLENLRSCTIHVVKDKMSNDRAKKIKEKIDKRLESSSLAAILSQKRKDLLTRRLDEMKRTDMTEVTRKSKEHYIKDLKSKLTQFEDTVIVSALYDWQDEGRLAYLEKSTEQIVALIVPELKKLIDGYTNIWRKAADPQQDPPFKRVKVALIDTGIISVDVNKFKRKYTAPIREGCSFSHSHEKEGNWWHAEDPHGTQMARLVRAIDPGCELFIARVGSNGGGDPVTHERVTKAINSAVKAHVDIICMSLALYGDAKDHAELLRAVRNAAELAILLCANPDEGYNQAKSLLDTESTIVLAACDRSGNILKNVNKDHYTYRVRGKEINVGKVRFIDSKPIISGSSVATAIAAGLASLTLSCSRFAGNPKALKPNGMKELVDTRFYGMTEKEDQYLRLPKFCKGRPDDPKGDIDEDFIRREFYTA